MGFDPHSPLHFKEEGSEGEDTTAIALVFLGQNDPMLILFYRM